MSETPEPAAHATIRRAPKLSMFMVVGGGLGAVVTFILTAIRPVDPQVGFGALLGYFMLYGIPAGVVLGAAVGLILDRRSRRRATGVSVERENVVEPEPVAPQPVQLDAEPLAEPLQPRAGDPDNPKG
ncbi:hypothetical protein [Homoserinimonas sp. A520]